MKKETQPVYLPEKEKTVPGMKEKEIIPSKKTSETANWKIYENTKGNYQIEIPKDWKVKENIEGEKTSAGVGSSEIVSTSFTSPDFQKHWANNGALIYDSGAILNVSVSAGKPVGSPDYCVKPNLEKIKAERYNKTDKELWKIDVAEFSCNWKTYYIFMICKTKNPASYEQIFKQVLSSFKFIETNEISDWEIYKNKEYGFEMKYPKGFFTEQVLQPKTEITQCDYANFINDCPTKIITVNDIPFCPQETSSGAAGTAYVTYNYTAIKNKGCFVVSFTVPYPNCSNFLPINNQEIQKAYDKCILDNEITKPKIINQILSTFKFTE